MWGCRACDYDLCERCHYAATMRDGRLSARQCREAAPAAMFATPFVSDAALDDSDGEDDDDTYEDESWSEDTEEDELSLENVKITCGECWGILELRSPVDCDCGGRHDQVCDQCPTPFDKDEYSFVCDSKTCAFYMGEERGYTVCTDCAVDEYHENRNEEKEERAQDRLAARKDKERKKRAALKVALASRGQAKADGGEGKADGGLRPEARSASFAVEWTRVEGVSQYEEADDDSSMCSRYFYRHNKNG